MTPAEAYLVRALDGLRGALTAAAPPVPVRESLRHPKHADVLAPIRSTAKAVLARFFKRQRALLLKEIDGQLRAVGDANPNKTGKLAEAAESDVEPLTLHSLPNAVTSAMSVDYAAAVTDAIAAGYTTLADDISSDKTISADATAAYLRDRSLADLAAQLEPTTVKRLQTALADAYEAGGDFDALVAAVTDEFDDMAETRAETIAQTAMNSAYNAGRKALGLDLGFDEKSWNPDGDACETCMGNVDDGWIPIEDAFASGDDAPSAHPNCDCSLDVRASAEALAA